MAFKDAKRSEHLLIKRQELQCLPSLIAAASSAMTLRVSLETPSLTTTLFLDPPESKLKDIL